MTSILEITSSSILATKFKDKVILENESLKVKEIESY